MSGKTLSWDFPKPGVTADALVFSLKDGAWHILLVQRKTDPYAGRWAVPGGFIELDETLLEAVNRELEEETGITGLDFEQLFTFDAVDRDPRGRTISTAFAAVTDYRRHAPRANDDAAAVQWFPLASLPDLAFDHDQEVSYAVEHYLPKHAG